MNVLVKEVSFRTGRDWHVSLLGSLEDLSPEHTAWTPVPGRNEIWSIVDHVAVWEVDLATRLAGRRDTRRESLKWDRATASL